ncbi:MAG: methylmalonyl-CoA mutase family protein [Pseudomonadota bacterium]
MFKKTFLDQIKKRKEKWLEKRYAPAAKKYQTRKNHFETNAGIKVNPLYTPDDLEKMRYFEEIGFPGEFPFTRGSYSIGYRERSWLPHQYCGFGTAEETNARLKFALKQGETGLNVIVDLPTSYHGIDADDPRAEGEVGKTGVSINSIEDMRDLFEGIPIDKISITFNTTGMVMMAMYFAMAQERGIPFKNLWGTVLNNPLASYVSCNSACLPTPKDAIRELTDFVEFAVQNLPKWTPFNIGSYEYRENGASAIQEMAFMFGNAIAYTDAFITRGMGFDEFAPRYVFYTSVQANLFEEIAKFRAARRIWGKIARDHYKAKNPVSMIFKIHSQTSGFSMTAQQPLNNIIRATIQSLAAVLGGTNSLYTNAYDEALCLPTEESLRTAMRVQQIIMEESGVTDTMDPLGGSYYVETLTNQTAERIWEIIREIDARGGMVKAVESGWIQSECERSVAEYLDKVEKGERVVVGYNKYQIDETVRYGVFTVDPRYELKQRNRLKKLRDERDHDRVTKALDRLREAARGGENMMVPCMEAALARATFGEMTDAIYGQMRSFRSQFKDLKMRMYS